jgi:hypothetical protein
VDVKESERLMKELREDKQRLLAQVEILQMQATMAKNASEISVVNKATTDYLVVAIGELKALIAAMETKMQRAVELHRMGL